MKKTKETIYYTRSHDSISKLAEAASMDRSELLALNPHIKAGRLGGGKAINFASPLQIAPIHSLLTKTNSAYFSALESDSLPLKIAFREFGQAAIAGAANNKRILEYLQTIDQRLSATLKGSDETDWCAAFMNWCVEQAGLVGTKSPAAIGWKKFGTDVLSSPQRGDIVVLKRWKTGDTWSWQGHIGFFLSMTEDEIELLGGNQSSSVSIATYPKNGVLGKNNYQLTAIRRHI